MELLITNPASHSSTVIRPLIFGRTKYSMANIEGSDSVNDADYRQYVSTAIEALKGLLKECPDIYTNPAYKQMETKEDGSPVTRADMIISKYLSSYLGRSGNVVSEETYGGKKGNMGAGWYIDPIDGTGVFMGNGEHSREFVTMITRVEEVDGKLMPVAAVIYAPLLGQEEKGENNAVYVATLGGGAYKGSLNYPFKTKIKVSNSSGNVGTSIKYGTDEEKYISKAGLASRKVGSALKACYVADGTLSAYLKRGPGLKPWDVLPMYLLVKEAGGKVTDTEGNEIDPMARNIGIILAHPDAHKKLLEVLKELGN